MTPLRYTKVFGLGDSRTGTTSLHMYLSAIGYKSIHLYETEAGMLPHTEPNYRSNCDRIVSFVTDSGYNAFSDFPTRLYYQWLQQHFPDSAFILTTRQDTDTWRRSITSYMSHFDITITDHRVQVYETINEDIRRYFGHADNFLDLCVAETQPTDDRLRTFLGYEGPERFGHHNTLTHLLETLTPALPTDRRAD